MFKIRYKLPSVYGHTVAAANPGSPDWPVMAVYPSKTPNLGMRLNKTPIMRGHNPEREAETGDLLNTALASFEASLGEIVSPFWPFAYCCTSWR